MIQSINLLILSDSPNQAEELASLARKLGAAVTTDHVNHIGEFLQHLGAQSEQIAIVIVSGDEHDELPSLCERQPQTPALALIDTDSQVTAGELLTLGFSDVAYLADSEHTKHCIQRAIEQHQQVSALETLQNKLEEARLQLLTLLQNTTQPVAYIHDGMHVYANPAYIEALGFSVLEDLQATPLFDLLTHTEERQQVSTAMTNLSAGEEFSNRVTLTFLSADEDELTYQCKLSAGSYDNEQAIQLILVSRLDAAETALPEPTVPVQHAAQISDPVTNVYSHHHMVQLLDKTIAHTRENDTEYLLYLIHLETGPDDPEYTDSCMLAAAEKLQQNIDEHDVLGRYSGNTFLLLTLMHADTTAEAYAAKLRSSIGDLDGLLPGITRSRVTAVAIDKLCKDSEQVLAQLKDAFVKAQEIDAPVHIESTQNLPLPDANILDQVWARQVSTILKDNRLKLISQSIISLRHDEWHRIHLQLQLADENGEAVPMAEFRSAVIKTGLASSVDRWIIFNAARQLLETLRETPTTQFFVPLIGNVILEDELFPWIRKIIEQFKLPADSIMLESSVDAALDHPDAFARFCQQMQAMQCGVHLTGADDPTIMPELFDDSKNRIKYVSVDESLLDAMMENTSSHEIVEILVAQCHREDTMTIVPEVVEPEVLSALWKLGVDLVVSNHLSDESDEMLELDLTATLSA